jgi:HK97 family phage major capsid protein
LRRYARNPLKKRKVSLDVFEESVLPTLQQKHTDKKKGSVDVAAMQKAISDQYDIYEEDEDGNQTPVKYTVSLDAQAKSVKADDDAEEAVEATGAMDAAAVKQIVAEVLKAQKAEPVERTRLISPKEEPTKFTIPAEVKRFGALKNFERKEVNGFSPDERAYRFGMWALAAMGRQKAQQFCRDQGIWLVESEQKTSQSEGTNTTGGYLVPEEFGTDLIDLREKYGVVRRLFKNRPMTSDTRTDPRRVTGLTAYFVAESGAGTESNKTWDNVRLTAKDLMILARMTNQLSEDSVISIGDDLAGEISYGFTLKEDQCGFLGDASSTYGGITGITTKLTTINGVDDGGGVVLASGNLMSEFTLGDFNRTVGRIPQYADTGNACWVFHRSAYCSTAQRLEAAAGGVTSMDVRSGNRAPRPLFLGYPVEFSQVLPATDANSQIVALFGDFTLAASFGDRRQDSIAFSDSATIGGESVFERNQIAVRGTERFDINVHDVGDSTNAGPVVGLVSASA